MIQRYKNIRRRAVNFFGLNRFDHFDNEIFLKYVAGKSNAFHEKSAQTETLALLSSYADYGFFPSEFPNSFNLGLTSSDLYTAYQTYSIHVKKLSALKRIILFYGVFSPGLSLIQTSERYRAAAYKYYFQIPYQDTNCINSIVERKIFKKCREISGPAFSDSDFGYNKKTFFFQGDYLEKRVATHLRENRRCPSQVPWLERLAELCSYNNHNLYVVIPPVRSDYRAALPPKSELFESIYFNTKCSFKIIDCFDGDVVDDDQMGDTDHPSEEGAIKLTHHLRRTINAIEGSR